MFFYNYETRKKKDKNYHMDKIKEALMARGCSQNCKLGKKYKSKWRHSKNNCAFG